MHHIVHNQLNPKYMYVPFNASTAFPNTSNFLEHLIFFGCTAAFAISVIPILAKAYKMGEERKIKIERKVR